MKIIRVGVVLAGGIGSRLAPTTLAISKHLFPVHDKPMIYYPISTLMLMQIKKIIIVLTNKDYNQYYSLLGNGAKFGLNISYVFQDQPLGIVDGILKCEKKINKKSFCVILGDNLFYGGNLKNNFYKISNIKTNSIIGYKVSNPENYGVINFSKNFQIKSIEEKPKKPKSDYVVTGIYFYENYVLKYLKKLKPSKRGELEISHLNNLLAKKGKLKCHLFGRGYAWMDMGTYDDLLESSQMIATLEKRQKIKIGCLEEIAFNNKWISRAAILNKVNLLYNNTYSSYLRIIANKTT